MEVSLKKNNEWCRAGKAFVGTIGAYAPTYALIANAEYFHQWTTGDVSFSVNVGAGVGSVGISWSPANGKVEGRSTVYIS